ncbi:unnamed protein product [Rhizoctonia solani]|uniref:Cytochrome P450 n=1 Tax=Rhizoctonia solani TaxID=456999 RepID=A0A8H3HQW7_9AGAM|nr:unnamed protein product [Rhizoctonia solani]
MDSHSSPSLLPLTLAGLKNFILSAIGQLVVGFFILNIAWKTYVHSRRYRGTVPHAPHLIPWVGNLKALLMEPVSWPRNMHEKLGEVFTTTVLGQNVTFLRGQPMITAFAKGSNRELEIIEGYKRIVTPLVGAELFSSNASEVREALTTQRLNQIQTALYVYIRDSIRGELEDRVPPLGQGWSQPMALQPLMSLSIFRMACFSLVSPTLAKVHSGYIQERMRSMEVNGDLGNILIPWETAIKRRRKRDRDEVLDCVGSYAIARIKELITVGEDEAADDFLGYIIKTTWSRDELMQASEEELHEYSGKVARRIYGLFFAGFLSTASRGTWCMHDLLTQNPTFITRVRSDIDSIVAAAREIGSDEPPRVEDHDFLNACFTETARIHPIGTWLRWAEQPFALPLAKDSTEPRIIPRGFVAVTTESIRNDTDLYGNDYEKYDPTRYYRAPFVAKEEFNPRTSQGIRLDSVRAPPLNMTSSMQPSFGVGAHQCAGRLFAYRMVTTFITTLFESFDVELVQTDANAGGKHKMVYTPLFGSRELMSDVTMRLRRREVAFK